MTSQPRDSRYQVLHDDGNVLRHLLGRRARFAHRARPSVTPLCNRLRSLTLGLLSFGLLLGACGSEDGSANTLATTESGSPQPATSTSPGSTTVGTDVSSSTGADTSGSGGLGPSSGGDATESNATDSSTSTGGAELACDLEGPPPMDECESPSPFEGPGECDPYADGAGGCAAGEKCLTGASYVVFGGGELLPDARCIPIDQTPVSDGSVCQRTPSDGLVLDNCGANSACWTNFPPDNDPTTGICVAKCGCGSESPTCDEGTSCAFLTNSLPDYRFCLPACDPLDETGMQCGPGVECQFVSSAPAPHNEIVSICYPNPTPSQVGEGCTGGCAGGTVCTGGTCEALCRVGSTELQCSDGLDCQPLSFSGFGGAEFDDCRVGVCE